MQLVFGLGVPELLVIFVLALLLFGPKRLPEIGRMLGRGMSELRKASNDLQRSLNTDIAVKDEFERELREASRELRSAAEPRSSGSTIPAASPASSDEVGPSPEDDPSPEKPADPSSEAE